MRARRSPATALHRRDSVDGVMKTCERPLSGAVFMIYPALLRQQYRLDFGKTLDDSILHQQALLLELLQCVIADTSC